MPRPPHTHLAVYADDTALLSQSWLPDPISRRHSNAITALRKYVTTWKLWLNTNKTRTTLFSKRRLPLPDPIQIQYTFVPWASFVLYLGLVLDSKLLFTRHLHTVADKSTRVFCNVFSLLARELALTLSSKLTLYKLLMRSFLTYAAPVWSPTCSSNYLRLTKLSSQNVSESSVTIPGVPPLPTRTAL